MLLHAERGASARKQSIHGTRSDGVYCIDGFGSFALVISFSSSKGYRINRVKSKRESLKAQAPQDTRRSSDAWSARQKRCQRQAALQRAVASSKDDDTPSRPREPCRHFRASRSSAAHALPGHHDVAKDRQQEQSGAALVELLKLRATPINRCAFSCMSQSFATRRLTEKGLNASERHSNEDDPIFRLDELAESIGLLTNAKIDALMNWADEEVARCPVGVAPPLQGILACGEDGWVCCADGSFCRRPCFSRSAISGAHQGHRSIHMLLY